MRDITASKTSPDRWLNQAVRRIELSGEWARKTDLRRLNRFAVESRYPGSTATVAEAKQAVSAMLYG